MTTEHATCAQAISVTLIREGWTLAEDSTSSGGASATVFNGPDRTTRLAITNTPGEPPVAELTGHPAGHPAITIWSLSINDPAEAQLLPIARAAAYHRLREVLALDDGLQRAGWTVHGDDKPADALSRISHVDGNRALTRLEGTEAKPGGWVLTGQGLHADATDGTPATVLAALARAPWQSTKPAPAPSTTYAVEASKPTDSALEPDTQ